MNYAAHAVTTPEQHILHIHYASMSRQPLVRSKTLVRYEVNAVIQLIMFRAQCTQALCLTCCLESLDCMSSELNVRPSSQILGMSIACDFDSRATT